MSQTSAKQQPDLSQWHTKTVTAEILQCSTKLVERFAHKELLEMRLYRRPSGGMPIAVYNPADVETQRRKRFPGTASSFVMPAPASATKSETKSQTSLPSRTDPQMKDFLRALTAVLGQAALAKENAAPTQKLLPSGKPRKPKPEVAIEHRPLLTVAEAAALGFPERLLRDAIASGELPAVTRGRTRIRRADLDRFFAEL